MSNKEYIRKHKEDRPVVAICYDFDKTLCTTDMQDCFTTGFPLSVLVPDESSVAAARRMIRELING